MKKNSLISLCCLLSACSSHYASNGESIYAKSQQGVSLVLPAPLTGVNITHVYDLPLVNGVSDVSILPPVDG